MNITGIMLSELTACVHDVSGTKYSGNIIVAPDAHELESLKSGVPRCVARLAARDSRGPGSRTAASGRHGRYACWHAYRDVLSRMFWRVNTEAVVRAGHAFRVTYRGVSGFELWYPETGLVNMGSAARPVTMLDLCQCTPAAHRMPVPGSPVTRQYQEALASAVPHTGAQARKRLDENEALITDPVFGPRVAAGTSFRF